MTIYTYLKLPQLPPIYLNFPWRIMHRKPLLVTPHLADESRGLAKHLQMRSDFQFGEPFWRIWMPGESRKHHIITYRIVSYHVCIALSTANPRSKDMQGNHWTFRTSDTFGLSSHTYFLSVYFKQLLNLGIAKSNRFKQVESLAAEVYEIA